MKKRDAKTIYYTHSFWNALAFSMIVTVNLIYQVEVAGLSPLELVLVGTALEVSAFLFEIPTGVVADVYSRRLSTILGVFISGVAFIIEGSFPFFLAIAGAQALWGFGWTFISGARAAWIADEVGAENVGLVYLRGGQLGSIGGLIGIPIAVLLARLFPINIPILVGGASMILLAVFLMFTMPETGFTPIPRAERENFKAMRNTLREGITLVRAQPPLIAFLFIGLFVGLYSEGYDRLWTPLFIDNFSFPDWGGLDMVVWFGIMRITISLFGLGAFEIVKRRLDMSDKTKPVRFLQIIYGVMVVSLAALALSGNFYFALLMLIVFNVFRGITEPIEGAWMNQFIDSKVRATVLSVRSQVDAFGQMAGGPPIGWVGNLLGVRAAMVMASAILAPVVLLFRRTVQNRDTTEK